MKTPLLTSLTPMTLVGGGPAQVSDLAEALALAPTCVAADAGADLALRAGVLPDFVIGDFDSISDAARARLPQGLLCRVDDQSTTDFEKTMARVHAPLLIGVGFLGGRLDHELGALHALAAFAHKPCILVGLTEITFLAPPHISFDAEQGDTVSLFPLGPCAGRSTGLHWPIAGLSFNPGAQIGTSNRATGPVALDFDQPAMLVILPRRYLSAIVTRLRAPAHVHWPAHAR